VTIGYNRVVPKTMEWRVDPALVVAVNTDADPSDADWDAFLKDLVPVVPVLRGMLVYTAGPGPSVSQRARANAVLAKAQANLPIAVMTSSRMARGIVTAFSWAVDRNIKAFAPTDFQGAVDFLGLSPDDQIKTKVVLKQLARTASITIDAFADESGQFRQKYGKS
jgi:hypothetical protein